MLSEELPAAIYAMLPCLSKDPSENFVAGASFGGFTAYKLALDHPEKFAAAGAFGGAFDVVSILSGTSVEGSDFIPEEPKLAFGTAEDVKGTVNDLFFLAEKCKKNNTVPKLWSVAGEQDFGIKSIKGALAKFKEIGLEIEEHFTQGGHDFDTWDSYVEQFLDWLPLKGGRR